MDHLMKGVERVEDEAEADCKWLGDLRCGWIVLRRIPHPKNAVAFT
jgi:hypothetical protein